MLPCMALVEKNLIFSEPRIADSKLVEGGRIERKCPLKGVAPLEGV